MHLTMKIVRMHENVDFWHYCLHYGSPIQSFNLRGISRFQFLRTNQLTFYRSILETAFGGSAFVCTKVRTQFGHIIDHVMAFNKQTMEPLPIADVHKKDFWYNNIAVDNDRAQ